jgi:hypothetical protein
MGKRKVISFFVRISAVFLLLVLVGRPVLAQSPAALNGIVKDASNAVVPGAGVTLTNVRTGSSQTRKTNNAGQYVFVDVQLGAYTLEVSKEGFATQKQTEFALEVNQTATIDLSLQVGTTATAVNVSAQATKVETSTAELGNVVGTQQVNSLPLNGRNFTQLLLLTPGMSQPIGQCQRIPF